MTTLGAPAGIEDTTLQLNGSYSSSGDYPIPITVESENMAITGGKGSTVVSVNRGLNGSAQVAHAVGATLTAGWGGGGGAISATDGTTTVAEVTSIRSAFAITDEGAGEAGINATIRAPEGAEGTGDLVFEIQGETGLSLASIDPYGALVLKGATVDPSNGGPYFQMIGSSGAVFSFTADNGAGGHSATIGLATTQLGFFGHAPASRPEVPAIPDAQDIVDVLVALGLVTQAS